MSSIEKYVGECEIFLPMSVIMKSARMSLDLAISRHKLPNFLPVIGHRLYALTNGSVFLVLFRIQHANIDHVFLQVIPTEGIYT